MKTKMFNSSSCFLFCLIFFVWLVPANVQAQAIPISTLEELNKIGRDPSYPLSGNYILTSDIDAIDTFNWPGGFEPIGNNLNRFSGTFDGQGYMIYNLYINRPSDDYIGLFGFIYSGQVSNLILGDCVITGHEYVGGIVGDIYTGRVEKCAVVRSVIEGSAYIGGIAGIITTNSNVEKNFVSGSIVWLGGSTSKEYFGGLAGYVNTGSSIRNCFSWADINTSVTDMQYVGGLIGHVDNSLVSTCYSTGSVPNGAYMIGGLLGESVNSTVTDCVWDIETSGQTTSGGGVGKTTAEMMNYDTYTAMSSWNISLYPCGFCSTTWVIYNGESYPFLCSLSSSIPNVVGMDETHARLAIAGAKLIPDVYYVCSNTVPSGTVIYTSRMAGCYEPLFNTVQVYISSGACPAIHLTSIEEIQKIGYDPDYPADNEYRLDMI